jgi:hypothetical protein
LSSDRKVNDTRYTNIAVELNNEMAKAKLKHQSKRFCLKEEPQQSKFAMNREKFTIEDADTKDRKGRPDCWLSEEVSPYRSDHSVSG